MSRIKTLTQRAEKTCRWKEIVTDDDDHWKTSCGEEFQWTSGGPTENGAKFCPYCGGKLEVAAKRGK
jgi:rRNA maturation endonuclease Nob1